MSAHTLSMRPDRMQALLAAGFSDLPNGEFLLLTIGAQRSHDARRWLRQLLASGLVVTVDGIGSRAKTRISGMATVAISHAGLAALGIRPSPTHPFPSIFSEGMGDAIRATQLGDDAAAWRWSDCASGHGTARQQVAHLLVAHYWSGQASTVALALFDNACLADAGLEALRIPVDPYQFQSCGAIEPFGFRDGMAQPSVPGLHTGADSAYPDGAPAQKRVPEKKNLVAAGEFVLGQVNEYGQVTYVPDVAGWDDPQTRFGQDASYIAVRQIFQDVVALEAFEAGFPAPPAGMPSVIEKMVGRMRDGSPLCPHDPADPEAFGFRIGDNEGFGCPRGAHIRRANPRDGLSPHPEPGVAGTNLHQLLRRGRAYRMVVTEPEQEPAQAQEQGMFFMAFNGDLERQFAFVQQRWIANPRFGGLSGESDPLLGQTHRAFTIQRPVGGDRVKGLPRFTRVVGGGYFLLASLPALDFVSRPDGAGEGRTAGQA